MEHLLTLSTDLTSISFPTAWLTFAEWIGTLFPCRLYVAFWSQSVAGFRRKAAQACSDSSPILAA